MIFSVCVDAVYYGCDLYKAIEELAENGIKNIEFWTWWDKDIERLMILKERYGINYVAFCTKFFSLVRAEEREDYLNAIEESCRVANRLGCKQLITKPGDITDESFEVQYAHMVGTLRTAAELAEGYDITILLEPVNSTLEAPDTFLDNSTLGFDIVEEVSNEHLKLLYDIYHMQISEGDVLRRSLSKLEKIGHFHAAGISDRHELYDGELNYGYIFKKIEEAGYGRFIGLEYFPVKEPVKGLIDVIKEHKYL